MENHLDQMYSTKYITRHITLRQNQTFIELRNITNFRKTHGGNIMLIKKEGVLIKHLFRKIMDFP